MMLPNHVFDPKSLPTVHYPVDIIAQCVRWYLAYALSLRNLEEMMAERGIVVDHSTPASLGHPPGAVTGEGVSPA